MKKNSFLDNIKDIFTIIGRAIKSAFVRAFFGTSKELSILEEEAIQSPLKVSVKKFFKKKLAIIGLVVFIFVILFCFVGSIFIKGDLQYINKTQANTSPGFNMMNIPSELEKNGILDIAVASTYSMGIDKNNKVYLWGQDINDIAEEFDINTTSANQIKRGLDLVKDLKAKRVWAGTNHFILEKMDGSLVSFGIVTDTISFKITSIPKNLLINNVMWDVQAAIKADGGVLDVVAEDQVTLVITKQNRVFYWGNVASRNYYSAIRDISVGKKVVGAGFSRSNLTLLFEDGSIAVLGEGSIKTNFPTDLTNAKQLVTTSGSAVVLTTDGRIVAWGDNQSNELIIDQSIQGKVVKLSKSAVGTDNYQHITALLNDGTVYSWGSNKYGESSVPKVLKGANAKAADVFSGFFQNYAVDENGKLIASWGLKGHIFGTDEFGRDVFERVMNGGRISLTIGLVAVIISTTIGILIGGIAGFYGGKVDILLMRLAEIVGSIPFLPLAMTFSAILNQIRTDFSTTDRMVMIMVILGVLSWPGLAQLIRAQILSEREKEFVTAAKALGVKSRHIIFRHIIPNVMTIIIINATLGYAGSLLTESGLSFLGFGVQLPAPSWGNMLSGAQDMTVIQEFWWRWVFPSIFLCLATISINIIGDSIRDAVDPRSREK